MITKFTHMNDGCLVWLDPTDGIGEDGTTSSKITSHSAGMYVEVYNDMIVLMGRKFEEESKYFGNCLYVIPTQDSERDVVKASISGELKVGETLTAHISEQGEYTYNWIVDGITVSTKNTYTVGEGLEDKYVYLRVIDKDGYYATVKSDVPVGTEKVTFGNAEGETVSAIVELEKQTTDCVVAVAVYDENDKMISLKFVYTNPSNIFVKVDKTLGAEYVKAFTLSSLSSLKPLIENTKTYLS